MTILDDVTRHLRSDRRPGPSRTPPLTTPLGDPGGRTLPPDRVLVADHDPVWRCLLAGVLTADRQLDVVAEVDGHRPVADWPLHRVDVVVLGSGYADPMAGAIRQVTARGSRVVLLCLDWTRHGLDLALTAGAVGCLRKDTDLHGLTGCVRATAGRNRILSADLLDFYVNPAPTGDRRCRDAVRKLTAREREILGLLGEGLSTAETARHCGVSDATVKSHVAHALAKLDVRNRLEAVLLVRDALGDDLATGRQQPS